MSEFDLRNELAEMDHDALVSLFSNMSDVLRDRISDALGLAESRAAAKDDEKRTRLRR